jgi:hypothetical protein
LSATADQLPAFYCRCDSEKLTAYFAAVFVIGERCIGPGPQFLMLPQSQPAMTATDAQTSMSATNRFI